MLSSVSKQRLCPGCSSQLFSLLVNGFSSSAPLRRHGAKLWSQCSSSGQTARTPRRALSNTRLLKASVGHGGLSQDNMQENVAQTPAQLEAIVQRARETFGETLPQDFLSEEEFKVYVRLYGPPSATTHPEDVDLLRGVEIEAEEGEEEVAENVLMRENAIGDLEEVVYDDNFPDGEEEEAPQLFKEAQDPELAMQEAEFDRRMAAIGDAKRAADSRMSSDEERDPREEAADEPLVEEEIEGEEIAEDGEGEDVEESEPYQSGDSVRTHPLTAVGRSGTWPSTLQLSKDTFVDPVTSLLSDASNKQLAEASLKIFGGPGLPLSTATVWKPNVKQQPITLRASKPTMGEMEGNAFMAAIMPGAYATIMSILVEIRKRLGSEWLRDLLEKPGGPRVLDAGSGGAGVLAWQESLRAEWALMHPGAASHESPVPLGKSTVVTGSDALRARASHLLDNTTFIPRLPDYDPARDNPSLEQNNPQPRKQYDLILAPHTLWSLKEDYMRKTQVQNFWSLLDPKGGVLVLIEKGIPRGFEIIAGARETLLKHHVASPGAEQAEHTIEDASPNRFGPKEKGMIIAPCTNHGKCPMYITAGTSQGRKDYCHFSQRYIRPPFLQRILNTKDRNHEDIMFSYVALQRGVDKREVDGVIQGTSATDAAFAGYEDAESGCDARQEESMESVKPVPKVSTLSLPRAILPPLKRGGHVILDLCTPSGKIERWTVPKSFSKQAYRDARKSKWGDLWALGAKTGVPRNIRVGLKKVKTRSRNVMNTDNEDEEDDLREVPIPRMSRDGVPKGMKGRKGKKARPKMVERGF